MEFQELGANALVIILNNAMAFIYAYFFSDFLRFDVSLLL